MAALTSPREIEVRAPVAGEGAALSDLWRELWESHEAWGGYAATRDARIYARVAERLDADAHVRSGQAVLGRHIHLVALAQGRVAGQVEGWFERLGGLPSTPHTCEVRSLVVDPHARGTGAGRALLEGLARCTRELSRGAPALLAAEVLEANPALAFYDRLGYSVVARTLTLGTGVLPVAPRSIFAARIARDDDALAVALLEGALAHRRRQQGDLRFDPPRAVDASVVSAIAAHLARASSGEDMAELVVTDGRGLVHGSATLAVAPLDPPFLPTKRAVLGRFAVDPAVEPRRLVVPLLALGCRLAAVRGAATLEVTDLPEPGFPLHEAVREAGARPWSRILCRVASSARI